jgi:AcrR family transcriptional regulator
VEDRASLAAERNRARGRPRDPGVDEAILAAAVDLLAEAGYARLTMDQVAARAGVGKASVYLRWPNKVALVAEAIRHRSGVVPDVPDTGRLREDMLEFLRGLLRAKPAAHRALTAVLGEIQSNPELRGAWRASTAGTLRDCLRLLVERAVARGELPPSSDVELLAMLPLALLQAWRLEQGTPPDERAAERIVDQFYSGGGSSAGASGPRTRTPRRRTGPDSPAPRRRLP